MMQWLFPYLIQRVSVFRDFFSESNTVFKFYICDAGKKQNFITNSENLPSLRWKRQTKLSHYKVGNRQKTPLQSETIPVRYCKLKNCIVRWRLVYYHSSSYVCLVIHDFAHFCISFDFVFFYILMFSFVKWPIIRYMHRTGVRNDALPAWL